MHINLLRNTLKFETHCHMNIKKNSNSLKWKLKKLIQIFYVKIAQLNIYATGFPFDSMKIQNN